MKSVAAVALLLTFQAYPPPFPRESVTKLLENDRVAVWRIDWVTGRPTPMHEHRLDLVGVMLDPIHAQLTARDGTVTTRQTKPADVLFQPRGVVHIEESIGDGGRTIAVELKDVALPSKPLNTSAPEGFPREGARLVLENTRVKVWDYAWRPGRPVGMHIHNLDTVSVPLEAGELDVTFSTGEARITRLVPGEVMFFSGAAPHNEDVRAGSPRAIAIELK